MELINTGSCEEADFLYMRWHIGTWEEENDYYTNLKDNEWSFIANLKNYRDPEHNVVPITLFMNVILKEIAAHIIRLEVWYGEVDGPEEYLFINNEFKKKLQFILRLFLKRFINHLFSNQNKNCTCNNTGCIDYATYVAEKFKSER